MTPANARSSRMLLDLALYDEKVSAGELRESAEDVLHRLLPSDDAFWITVDFVASTVDIARGRVEDPELGRSLVPVVADDPILRSFVARPHDLTPRRQSDVATREDWERTETYDRGFHGRPARYRLSYVFALDAPVRGFGWSTFRQHNDFSDRELDTAKAVEPLITVIASVTRPHWRPLSNTSEVLTPREMDILRLLATGRPARVIAGDRHIAEGTVRKHVEHIYDKLGVHERVTALAEGRRRGYL